MCLVSFILTNMLTCPSCVLTCMMSVMMYSEALIAGGRDMRQEECCNADICEQSWPMSAVQLLGAAVNLRF